MATLERLLDMPADGYCDVNEVLDIDPVHRQILIPNDEIILGVEADKRAERKYFRIPKSVGSSINVCACKIHINYVNANGETGYAMADQILEEGDYVFFSWLIDRAVTKYKGDAKFIICLCTYSGTQVVAEWHTTLATAKVLEGLEAVDPGTDDGATIIAKLLAIEAQLTVVEQHLEQVEAKHDALAEHVDDVEKGMLKIDDASIGANPWSSRNIVDKTMPGFAVSGKKVSCNPIEGTVLEVISAIPDIVEEHTVRLYRRSRNLIKNNKMVGTTNHRGVTYTALGDGRFTLSGTATAATTIRLNYSSEYDGNPADRPTFFIMQPGVTYRIKDCRVHTRTDLLHGYTTYNAGLFTPSEPLQVCGMSLYIAKGDTFDASKIYEPMICVDDGNDTYAPYEEIFERHFYGYDVARTYNWNTGSLATADGEQIRVYDPIVLTAYHGENGFSCDSADVADNSYVCEVIVSGRVPVVDNNRIGASAWSSETTVEKLCPTLSETAQVVRCNPLVGYPLSVKFTLSKITMESGTPTVEKPLKITVPEVKFSHGNINLFDFSQITEGEHMGWETEMVDAGWFMGYESTEDGVISSGDGKLLREYAPGLVAGQMYTLSGDVSSTEGMLIDATGKLWRFGSSMKVTAEMLNSTISWQGETYGTEEDGGPWYEFGFLEAIQIEPGTVKTTPMVPYNTKTMQLDFLKEFGSGTYDLATGVVECKQRVITLDGTENVLAVQGTKHLYFFFDLPVPVPNRNALDCCTHFPRDYNARNGAATQDSFYCPNKTWVAFQYSGASSADEFKQFLKDQYDAGTPVQLLYNRYTSYSDDSSIVREEAEAIGHVQPLEGENALSCSTGNLTVTGREDINATIEKLTSAIISLGGTI